MTIGLVYDLHSAYPWRPGDPRDADAEYEPVDTVEVLEAALRRLGHTPIRIGTPADLLSNGPGEIDAAVNIAEGAWTRNREGWAPTLLEMWGIPFIGSDALALSMSLDKVYTKQVAAACGLHTPTWISVAAASDIDEDLLPGPFPLFVKPRREGTAKGIGPKSVVRDMEALRLQVQTVTQSYEQEALVETFITGGGEFTVAVAGSPRRALPVLQRALDAESEVGLHAVEGLHADVGLHAVEGEEEREWKLGGAIDADLEARMQADALKMFDALGCRDFARSDFRVDGEGKVWFLEINPLPTFAPDGTFAVIAELMGRPYEDLLAEILAEALDRAVREAPRLYATRPDSVSA